MANSQNVWDVRQAPGLVGLAARLLDTTSALVPSIEPVGLCTGRAVERRGQFFVDTSAPRLFRMVLALSDMGPETTSFWYLEGSDRLAGEYCAEVSPGEPGQRILSDAGVEWFKARGCVERCLVLKEGQVAVLPSSIALRLERRRSGRETLWVPVSYAPGCDARVMERKRRALILGQMCDWRPHECNLYHYSRHADVPHRMPVLSQLGARLMGHQV